MTPIGVQEGGEKIAQYEGIQTVHLDADSTTTSYILKFLGNIFIGVSAALVTVVTFAPEVTVNRPRRRRAIERVVVHGRFRILSRYRHE